MRSSGHSTCHFIDYDELTSLSNPPFAPSESISIKGRPTATFDMFENDDDDILIDINRTLQDFNESMTEKPPAQKRDDSAYATAASSLSNQEAINSFLAEEFLARINMSEQVQFRNPSGDTQFPSWNNNNNNSYGHQNKSAAGMVTSRRRLQSCSVIGSSSQPWLDSQTVSLFESINSPNPSNQHTQEVLCHPKFCPQSPVKMRQMRCQTGAEEGPQRVPGKRVSAYSCSIDAGHQIAKGNRACSFFLRGHCKKEDCEFAHDLSKVTCRFWKAKCCIKGESCPFLHGYPPETADSAQPPPLSSSLPSPSMQAFQLGTQQHIKPPPGFHR